MHNQVSFLDWEANSIPFYMRTDSKDNELQNY